MTATPTRRLLVFNPDFEEELARRGPVPAPSRLDRARERLERRLAARFLFLGSPGDALLAPWELPSNFRQLWRDRNVELPEVVATPPETAAATTPLFELLPWGAAPSLAGLSPHPGLPPAEVVRRANSKVVAHEIAARLGLESCGWICGDVAEVEARLQESFRPGELWVIKRAFGFAARGHLLGRGPELPPSGAGWLRRAFESGDPVVLEPWLPRERDLSIQLVIERAPADSSPPIHVVGVLEMLAAKNGAYVGNRFGALGLEASLVQRLEESALAVGRELAREGYFGPVGIDAFVHSGGRLRLLCEINARHTMGRVALAFAKLLAPGGVGSWISARSSAVAAALESGVAWSTDPWPLEPGDTSVVLRAKGARELAALEKVILTESV